MPTYPLPTLACTVDATGITAPPYDQILSSLKASYQTIFGADAYLEPDSQDGQLLAIFAKAVSDGNQADIATYNNFSPSTSQGAGLSSAVKMNGLARAVPTYSTVDVLVGGVSGSVISGGIVSDVNGAHQWALPGTVTIPVAGQITVTAICADPGAIQAQAATITKIVTPTLGWQTVSNAFEASPGSPVESDAALRRRQAIAAAQPAVSAVGAILSSLGQLTGVTDVVVHENSTGSADAQGVPAHAVAVVLVGGDVNVIAASIATTKSPGCATFGTTTIATTDASGIPENISFSRPAAIVANVTVNVVRGNGYSSTVTANQVAAINAYLNGLTIGQPLFFNRLWAPSQLIGTPDTITFQVSGITLNGGSADISPAYNQQVVPGTITIVAS